MKIIHRYILSQFLRNLFLSLVVLVALFLIFDFIDRLDNMVRAQADFGTIAQYFLLKMPFMTAIMMPIAALVSTLLTVGMLSRSLEITAMQSSGLTIRWIARPVFVSALLLSVFVLLLNEFVIPHTQRRTREIYNIDIRKKDEKGTYNRENYWWRSGSSFYSASMFDSRTSSIIDFSEFVVTPEFKVVKRIDADQVDFVNPSLGWSMKDVIERSILPEGRVGTINHPALPLIINEVPEDFYQSKTDPFTMSFFELKDFIRTQEANGLSTKSYQADLHAKISFPFVVFVVVLAGLPFALLPARGGSLAPSFMAGIAISFAFYTVHSFSIAMGRAEFWPPMLAAWMAILVIGLIGFVLNLGAESPS